MNDLNVSAFNFCLRWFELIISVDCNWFGFDQLINLINLQYVVFVPEWIFGSFLRRCLVPLWRIVHFNDGVHFLHVSCSHSYHRLFKWPFNCFVQLYQLTFQRTQTVGPDDFHQKFLVSHRFRRSTLQLLGTTREFEKKKKKSNSYKQIDPKNKAICLDF